MHFGIWHLAFGILWIFAWRIFFAYLEACWGRFGSTTLLYLVPPVAVVIAFVWLGELPYPAELVGGVIVITGVIVVSQGARLGLRIRDLFSTTRA